MMTNSKEVYSEIVSALELLVEKMKKENPVSLFTWVLESKIRAYRKKLRKAAIK